MSSISSMSNGLSFLTDVSLKDKTWFNTGGIARFYCEPSFMQEFEQALIFAKDRNLPIFVLGQGANILISDDGFDGLVIRPQLCKINIIELSEFHALVEAGSGVPFSALIDFCLENKLIGLEEFSGIPGTVGGSVYINIHYFEFLLSQFLISAQVIERATGKILLVDNSWFNFGYDQSTLIDEKYYLITATFKVKRATEAEAAYALGKRDEIIRHRVRRYPNKNTCGSFFRNFHESEVTIESNGKKMIYVAYYLDKIGVKGELKIGDAIVSYQHANMLINKGHATSGDIIKLAKTMQEMVLERFGVIPQPECRLIGFKEYPLL